MAVNSALRTDFSKAGHWAFERVDLMAVKSVVLMAAMWEYEMVAYLVLLQAA